MPLIDAAEIEAWARREVRPTALARRTAGSTEPLLRRALAEGMADWLLAGGETPKWEPFLLHLTALGRGAADLGFGVSVMVQNLVTGLHLGLHARRAGAAQVLAEARAGKRVVAFAVTEPEVGAHPGKLRSKAEHAAGQWRLTGAKTFSTNGMIADDVILICVSGASGGRNRFVAVAVPTHAPGFHREEIKAPVCPTATHATFRFDVLVGDDRQLGDEGDAYLNIVRPFRAYEDLAGAALFLGHLEGLEADGAFLPAEARGRLRALTRGLAELVREAGELLDEGLTAEHDAVRLAIPYLLEPAVKLVHEAAPGGDELWQARALDAGMAGLGANVRRRFYERIGGAVGTRMKADA
jgi:alkylation response protein AidB-like acyl-CoA dehydrogenase